MNRDAILLLDACLVVSAFAWWALTFQRQLAIPHRMRLLWAHLDMRFAASRLSPLAGRFSERHLINFDLATLVLCAIGLASFVGLVSFKIHGSSIEMWNQAIPFDDPRIPPVSLLAGKPKLIRSDEWVVATPQLLHEYTKPGGQTWSGKTLDAVSPWTWGFHVLGLERGFSFMWDFWLLACLYSVFFLAMLLTGNHFRASLFTSLFLFFSSYNRWWDITVYVASFSLVLTSLLYFLRSEKCLNIWIAFLTLTIFGFKFVLLLYPAWQITLGYLIIFIVTGSLLEKGAISNVRTHLLTKLTLASLGLAGALGVAALIYSLNHATLAAMSDTIYPGRRFSTGGDIGVLRLFSGYLDSFFDETHFIFGNICESSSFIFLFPFVIAAIVRETLVSPDRRMHAVVMALTAYLVALTGYILIGYGSLVARASLLSYVPATRAQIGLGVGGILLVAVYASNATGRPLSLSAATLVAAISFAALVTFAIFFDMQYSTPDWRTAAPVCLVLAIAIGCLLSRRHELFYVLMLLLVIIPSWNTNPVAMGLDPIYSKRLAKAIPPIAAAHPGDRWLVYGGSVEPQFVKAVGADVFNGVQWPPELGALHQLDPAGAHRDVWNRFAHVMAEPGPVGSVEFKLVNLDAYRMVVSPEEPALAAVRVRLFVAPASMQGAFPATSFRRLTPAPLNGYLIFERLSQ